VTVNTGGTLLFSSTDAINHSATVAVNGGTISMQGLSGASEKMGALTLGTGNSTINFGTGNGSSNTLTFASLSGLSATNTLTILYWTGSAYSPGSTTDTAGATAQDHLLFSTDPSLNSSQLADISFYDDSGNFIGNGADLSFGFGGTPEIAAVSAVPEPSTIFGGFCLVGLLGWRNRRRILEVGRHLAVLLS
jgi:hypothetical protein